MKRKAFTLVEILIVVILLGILATIAITSFSDLTGDATENVRLTILKQAKSAIQVYAAQNPSATTVTAGDLDLDYDATKWTITITPSATAGRELTDATVTVVAAS